MRGSSAGALKPAWLSAVVALIAGSTGAHAAPPPAPATPTAGIFAADELGTHGAKPAESAFSVPFKPPLPARVVEKAGVKQNAKQDNSGRLVDLADCRDYLAVRERIVGSDNDADYRALRAQVVPCDALALLGSAAAPLHSALPGDFTRQTATGAYPASIWPAISDQERSRLSTPGATVQTASGKPAFHKASDGALEVEGRSLGVRLTLLARGDFNHDGWEDAAFRLESYALKGSYADAKLVVLTRTGSDRRLRELQVDGLLQAR